MQSFQAPEAYVNASFESILFADNVQFGFSVENSLVSREEDCGIGKSTSSVYTYNWSNCVNISRIL